jgi:hypothetical protein
MFFSDPMGDMQITIFLVMAGIIIALVVGLVKRSWPLFVIWASVFGNTSFLLNIGSRMFTFYHIEWMKFFSLVIWPIVNLSFIIWHFRLARNEKRSRVTAKKKR